MDQAKPASPPRRTWGRMALDYDDVPPQGAGDVIRFRRSENGWRLVTVAPRLVWSAILTLFVTSHPWFGAVLAWLTAHGVHF